MPVTKTAEIWIELEPLSRLKDKFQPPRLYFWDDGSRPYWAFDVDGTRAFIPSSREAALGQGLLIFWATLFGDSQDPSLVKFNAYESGSTPIDLADFDVPESLLNAAKASTSGFHVRFRIEPGSYVAGN